MQGTSSMGLAAMVVVAAVGATACSSSSASGGRDTGEAPQQSLETGPPLEFDLPQSYIPSPGFCRIYYPERPEESDFLQAQSCSNIEYSVMTGGIVLYRPRDGSRNVHVCYMSRSEPSVVDGIDVVSIDKRRVVRVILPRMRRTADDTQRCTYNP